MNSSLVLEIKKYGHLIFDFKKMAFFFQRRDLWAVGQIYKNNLDDIKNFIEIMKKADEKEADFLNRLICAVTDSLDDCPTAEKLINKGILPILYKYMEKYKDNYFEGGRYTISPSLSGSFSLKNNVSGINLISLDDPLWEAFIQCEEIYDADCFDFVLMGAGLGYLPYFMWIKSAKSMDVYIYENDKSIVEYALEYGYLGLIDKNKLHIIIDDDFVSLCNKFDSYTRNDGRVLKHISEWMPKIVNNDFSVPLYDFIENSKTRTRFKDYYDVNFLRNNNKFCGLANEFLKTNQLKEAIIVAAGPSVNYNISFIKENKGSKLIICVSTILKRLLSEGITPDIVVVADPNENVFSHIKNIDKEALMEITLIAETVANWEFVNYWPSSVYKAYACDYYKSVKECEDNNISPWYTSGTVSSFAISAAICANVSKIYLVGLDLAYPGDKFYAEGAIGRTANDTDNDGSVIVKASNGKMVATNKAFDQFRRGIEIQISRCSGVLFINCSKDGALIEGTKNFF